MITTVFYLVGKSSPAMAVIREVEATRSRARICNEAFKEKYGISEFLCYSDQRIVGVRFARAVPAGWRVGKDWMSLPTYYVPNLRSKAGKDLAEEIKALPVAIDDMGFAYELQGETAQKYVEFAGNHIHYARFGRYGAQFVLAVPAMTGSIPADCTELKYSEYLAIVEAAKAAHEAHKEQKAA